MSDSLILAILSPILNFALVGIGTFITVKIVPPVLKYIEAKIGTEKYNKLRNYGYDMFMKIEEEGRLGNLVSTKIVTFRGYIKTKFPAITDADIDLLRDSLAGEFNRDKKIIEALPSSTSKLVDAAITSATATINNAAPTTPGPLLTNTTATNGIDVSKLDTAEKASVQDATTIVQ